MQDVAGWVEHWVQLTTDGHRACLNTFEGAFGADMDYTMLIEHTVHQWVSWAATAPVNARALTFAA